MFSTLYVSDELTPFDEKSLRELSTASAASNRRHGVTGCLGWKNGRFVQYLEGEEQAVRSIVKRIAADDRHRVVRVLELPSIESRLFGHWDVGFLRPRDISEIRVQDLIENIMRSMRGPAYSDPDVERMLVPMLRVMSKSAESIPNAEAVVTVGRADARAAESSTTIVGIGASAGGLQPLQEFFRTVATDLDAVFVVIQHFSPNVETVMDSILQRETRMPVRVAGEGMLLEPRSIYVIPPGHNLELMHGGFRLHDQQRENNGPQYPIDIFFRSMAKEYGSATVAIVLSGTGTDGSRGVRSVREAGGVVLTQSVESSEFDGMPTTSIQSGVVQHSLKPFQIAEYVGRLVDEGLSVEAQLDEETRQAYVDRIVALMDASEVDFSQYRVETLFRRVERRRVLLGIPSVERYIDHFSGNEEERHRLRDDLLITVTSFFRDEQAWEALAEEVIPQLVETMEDGQTFRAWVTACATGEEAYTLAMVLTETLERLERDIDFKIYATDIERRALDRASSGRYGESAVIARARRPPRPLLRAHERGLHDRSIAARERHLRAAQLRAGRPVHEDAPRQLPQRADLHAARAPAAGAEDAALLPQRRRRPVSRHLGDARGDTERVLPAAPRAQPLPKAARLPDPAPPEREQAAAIEQPAVAPGGQTRDRRALDSSNAVSLALLAKHVGKTLVLVDENRHTQLVIADPLSILEIRPGAPSSDVIDLMPHGMGASLTIAIQSAVRDETLVKHGSLASHPDEPALSRTLDLEVSAAARAEGRHAAAPARHRRRERLTGRRRRRCPLPTTRRDGFARSSTRPAGRCSARYTSSTPRTNTSRRSTSD